MRGIIALYSPNNPVNARTVSFPWVPMVKGCIVFGTRREFGADVQSNAMLSTLLQGSVQQHSVLGRVHGKAKV